MTDLIFFLVFLGVGYILGRLHPRKIQKDEIISTLGSMKKALVPRRKVIIFQKKVKEDPNYRDSRKDDQTGDTPGA